MITALTRVLFVLQKFQRKNSIRIREFIYIRTDINFFHLKSIQLVTIKKKNNFNTARNICIYIYYITHSVTSCSRIITVYDEVNEILEQNVKRTERSHSEKMG